MRFVAYSARLSDRGATSADCRLLVALFVSFPPLHFPQAPECLLSDNYTELVDIWSLGITAYELAVGQPPHAELHSLRAALKIPQAEPPTLPHPERFSPELHSFLRSCLVKDYTRRPSAAELLNHPFIVNNQSTPAILLDMVARTRSAIEAKTAAANANAGSGAGASSASSSSAAV